MIAERPGMADFNTFPNNVMMNNKDDFFDDLVDAEEWTAETEPEGAEMWAQPGDDDEDEDEIDVRTVLMAKSSMIALLSLKTSTRGGVIVRYDPREEQPAAQVYNDPSAASKWFNRSLATSRKNGWNIIYDGVPMYG